MDLGGSTTFSSAVPPNDQNTLVKNFVPFIWNSISCLPGNTALISVSVKKMKRITGSCSE